jgi:hypothetical protein
VVIACRLLLLWGHHSHLVKAQPNDAGPIRGPARQQQRRLILALQLQDPQAAPCAAQQQQAGPWDGGVRHRPHQHAVGGAPAHKGVHCSRACQPGQMGGSQ